MGKVRTPHEPKQIQSNIEAILPEYFSSCVLAMVAYRLVAI